MSRISRDEYYMGVARIVAQRSTCARRCVGCVLVDSNGYIMATGHNGVPRHIDHCINHPCPGAAYASGTGLDKCWAVHAEANALIQCRRVEDIVEIYTTSFPCIHCLKMIMNTPCRHLIYDHEYPTWDQPFLENVNFKYRQMYATPRLES